MSPASPQTRQPCAGTAPSRDCAAVRGAWAAGLAVLLLAVLTLLRMLPYLRGDVPAVVFEHLTLPRMLGAVLAGAGLAVSGGVLQGLTRNPLASPGLLGITSGAHLAIVLALVLFDGRVPLVMAGFAGSLVALGTTWLLAGPGGRHGTALALAGVAVTLCMTAFASAITLLNEQQMAGAFLWSAGAPLMTGWPVIAELAPWLVAGLVLAAFLARGLDVLALGSMLARSLAARPERLTAVGFVAAGLAAGAAVALVGPVAFVGLIAPNALRRLGVRRHHWLLPACGLWGGVLLLAADWAAVALSAVGREVPVGVVTAVVGAPVFLALIAGLRSGSGETAGLTGRPRRRGVLPLALLACLSVAGATLALGETDVTAGALLEGLFRGTGDAAFVVRELRLPRLLVALTAGALLALAGGLLQAALRNPLAGPETLGLVQGAALASLLVLMAGLSPGGPLMQLAALAGGLAAVAVVFAVARRAQLAPAPLVLGGVALASLLAALAALVVLTAKLQATQALVWLTGSAYARGWPDWLALLPGGLLAAIAAVWLAPRLDTAALGDTKARTLGLAVVPLRAASCVVAALATAVAVSVVGSVAFVGLLGPHLARLLGGGPLLRRLPLVVVCGAALTAAADLAGRTLFAPVQLPMGVMTALIGAPYFLWLLRAARRPAAG